MNLIDGIKGNKFVVFGRAGMDMFAEPIGTKSEFAESFRSDLGGSSANICAGLCKLGSEASLVTSVSDDAVGRFCPRLQAFGPRAPCDRKQQGKLSLHDVIAQCLSIVSKHSILAWCPSVVS